MVQYEWDPAKAASNAKKHGINFRTASKVFDDPAVVIRQDRIVDGEDRWQAIGSVLGASILLVAHTYPHGDEEDVIRIISARKADRKERYIYEQNRIGRGDYSTD